MLAGNERVNLTAITDAEEFWEKHIEDSLAGVEAARLGPGLSVVDLGSGAGLPGIPLAVAVPGIRLTLVEAAQRKARFLEAALAELGIEGHVIHGRAEDLGRSPEHRERHDRVVARAVAPLRVLVELALPLVRVGGLFVAWKGPAVDAELSEAEHAIAELGGRLLDVAARTLPSSGAQRRIVVLEKDAPAPPRYPRRAGVPERKPL